MNTPMWIVLVVLNAAAATWAAVEIPLLVERLRSRHAKSTNRDRPGGRVTGAGGVYDAIIR